MTLEDALYQISLIAQTWHDRFHQERVLKRTLKLQGEHVITAVRQFLTIADTADIIALHHTLETLTATVARYAHVTNAPIPAWQVAGQIQVAFGAPPTSVSLVVFAPSAEGASERALDEIQRRYRGRAIEITTWEEEPTITPLEGKQTNAD